MCTDVTCGDTTCRIVEGSLCTSIWDPVSRSSQALEDVFVVPVCGSHVMVMMLNSIKLKIDWLTVCHCLCVAIFLHHYVTRNLVDKFNQYKYGGGPEDCTTQFMLYIHRSKLINL